MSFTIVFFQKTCLHLLEFSWSKGGSNIYNTWVQPSGVYSIKWNIQQSCQKTPFGFTSSCPSFLWGQSPWPAPPGCPPSSPPLSSSLSTSPSPCRAPPEHSVYFLQESIIQKYLLKMLQIQQYDWTPVHIFFIAYEQTLSFSYFSRYGCFWASDMPFHSAPNIRTTSVGDFWRSLAVILQTKVWEFVQVSTVE